MEPAKPLTPTELERLRKWEYDHGRLGVPDYDLQRLLATIDALTAERDAATVTVKFDGANPNEAINAAFALLKKIHRDSGDAATVSDAELDKAKRAIGALRYEVQLLKRDAATVSDEQKGAAGFLHVIFDIHEGEDWGWGELISLAKAWHIVKWDEKKECYVLEAAAACRERTKP